MKFPEGFLWGGATAAIKQGNEIVVAAEGSAEDDAIAAVQKFFEENL